MQCTTSKAGKRAKAGTKGTEHTQREGAGAHHLHPVDTTTKGTHDTTHQHHIPKICLDFALSCLRKSRENTKAHQKIIHFCHFLP